MQMMYSQFAGWLLAATVLAPSSAPWQQQTPGTRADWPCGAKLDAAYFAMAEATGGHVWLTPPDELPKTAAPLAAMGDHRQTLFRRLGTLNAGTHEFRVPIDPSIESVAFSMSVQCLQNVELLSPSGVFGQASDVNDFSSRAWRVVVVKRPEPGIWTIRAAGSGFVGVIVQARSALRMTQVQFGVGESTTLVHSPRPGRENVVWIGIEGATSQVEASLVDATFRRIAPLPLTAGPLEGTYLSRFTPGAAPFRVLVEGKDANGVSFQRLHAPLFTPD